MTPDEKYMAEEWKKEGDLPERILQRIEEYRQIIKNSNYESYLAAELAAHGLEA